MTGIKFYAPEAMLKEELEDGQKIERLAKFTVREKDDGSICLEMTSLEGFPITIDLLDDEEEDKAEGETEADEPKKGKEMPMPVGMHGKMDHASMSDYLDANLK